MAGDFNARAHATTLTLYCVPSPVGGGWGAPSGGNKKLKTRKMYQRVVVGPLFGSICDFRNPPLGAYN